MALPATGGTYAQLLQPGINELNIRKWTVTDILIRDYRNVDGTVHNLADPAVGISDDGYFTPYAQDGTLRSDLLGPDGLGFYHLGALSQDGINQKADVQVDETYIAQSIYVARNDVKSQTDTIHIKAFESNPLTDALRFGKPLSNLADLGKAGYVIAKDPTAPLIERQVIALGFDKENFVAYVYPRMSLKQYGDANMNKTDVDDTDITLDSLVCPYVMSPVLLAREGREWRGLQGAPAFAAAPVATAVSGQKATVAFAMPTSASSSFQYTVSVSNDGSTWTPADGASGHPAIVSVVGTTNPVITLSGITSSLTWYFRVVATGSNAVATTSATSNSVIGLS
jgi:hypothetical protein